MVLPVCNNTQPNFRSSSFHITNSQRSTFNKQENEEEGPKPGRREQEDRRNRNRIQNQTTFHHRDTENTETESGERRIHHEGTKDTKNGNFTTETQRTQRRNRRQERGGGRNGSTLNVQRSTLNVQRATSNGGGMDGVGSMVDRKRQRSLDKSRHSTGSRRRAGLGMTNSSANSSAALGGGVERRRMRWGQRTLHRRRPTTAGGTPALPTACRTTTGNSAVPSTSLRAGAVPDTCVGAGRRYRTTRQNGSAGASPSRYGRRSAASLPLGGPFRPGRDFSCHPSPRGVPFSHG